MAREGRDPPTTAQLRTGRAAAPRCRMGRQGKEGSGRAWGEAAGRAREREQGPDTGGALPVSGEHGGLGSEGPAGSGQSAEDGGPGRLHAAAGCCVLLSRGASDASVRGEARGRGCPRSGLRGGAMEGEASAAGAEVGALRSERPGPERCVGLMRPLPLMTSAGGRRMSGPDGWRPEMLAGRMVRLFIEMGSHAQEVLLGGGKEGKM